MSFPGFPDGMDPGWFRIAQSTPPVFTLTGILDGTTSTITVASPFVPQTNPPPLVGQQVSGTGIPALATVVSVSSSSFAISANTTQSGTRALTIGAEPVSVAQAMAWGIIENPDTTGLLTLLIQAARERAEADVKRAVMLQAKTMYFMAFPWSGYYSLAIRGMGLNPWWFPLSQGFIKLPYPTLQQVTLIQYVDVNGTLQTIDPANYRYQPNATPGLLQPAYGTIWPVARPEVDSVQITFTCGYGPTSSNVPASLQLAMQSLIAAGYRNREAFMSGQPLEATKLYESLLNTENYGFYG